MTFVTAGLAIAGILAVAIPIIIHLLWRQRKRPVEWAAMRFLIEAFKKQKRRLQIENLLLLIVRCLILAVLGFALARPLLQSAGLIESDSGRVVLLVVDNGMASGIGETPETSALSRHRADALEVLASLGPAEQVGVITAARPIDPPVLPPSLDHDSIARVIESITTSEAPSDIPAALHAAREASAEYENDGQVVVVYLFSDFRLGSATLDRPLPHLFDSDDDRFVLLAAPPATTTTANVQVVAITPVRRMILPGVEDASNQVAVHLSRHGGELGRGTTRVRLQGENLSAIAPKTVTWEPGQSDAAANFVIDFTPAQGKEIGLTAIIDDADSLDLDNRRYTTLDVRDRLHVAMLSPPTFLSAGQYDTLTPGQWIRWALSPTEGGVMDVVDILPSNLTEVDLRAVDVAIATRPDRLGPVGWRALRHFVDDGGLVIVVPPAELNVHPWTDRLIEELDLPWQIDLETTEYPSEPLLLSSEHPSSELMRLIAGELTDLTKTITVHRALKVNPDETQAEVILEFEDGTPMMILGVPRSASTSVAGDTAASPGTPAPPGTPGTSGMVVYLAVSPDSSWSNLPVHPFILPLFQETLRQGMNIIRGRQNVTVGERAAIAGLPRGELELVGPGGKVIDVDHNRRPSRPFETSGAYHVRDASGVDVGVLAVNVEAQAGRTDVQSGAAIGDWLGESGAWSTFDPKNPTAALAGAETGISLAGTLLVILLLLVLLETILARRFSHAYRSSKSIGLSGGLRSTIADAQT